MLVFANLQIKSNASRIWWYSFIMSNFIMWLAGMEASLLIRVLNLHIAEAQLSGQSDSNWIARFGIKSRCYLLCPSHQWGIHFLNWNEK